MSKNNRLNPFDYDEENKNLTVEDYLNNDEIKRELVEKEFEELNNYIGKNVTVKYISYGHKHEVLGRLRKVENYRSIEVLNLEFGYIDKVPFIGEYAAITRIAADDEVLYSSLFSADKYVEETKDFQPLSEQTIYEFRKEQFGYLIAEEEKKRELDKKIEERLELEALEKAQEKEKYIAMKDGIELINPDFMVDWFEFVDKNMDNNSMVESVMLMLGKLESGISMEEMENIINNELDISGYMKDWVRAYLLKFSKRGKEYSMYLTEKCPKYQKIIVSNLKKNKLGE